MDLLRKNIILSFFIMLFGFNLNAQFGSINVLTRDGENILVPICNIAYVYETPDGAELITDGFNYKRDDQEKRILKYEYEIKEMIKKVDHYESELEEKESEIEQLRERIRKLEK
jgi:hypothetical protein